MNNSDLKSLKSTKLECSPAPRLTGHGARNKIIQIDPYQGGITLKNIEFKL